MGILAGRTWAAAPSKTLSPASGLRIIQPSPLSELSLAQTHRVTHPSSRPESAQIRGLGLYFKAISGLNRQPHQTLILHLGATVTTIFLGAKAVQRALERARESWRQRIFSRGVTQPVNRPLQDNRYIQTLGSSRKHCMSFLVTSLAGRSAASAASTPFPSQRCCVHRFGGRCSTSTMVVLQNLTTGFPWSYSDYQTCPLCVFLCSCLVSTNENNVLLPLWEQNRNTRCYLALKYCD